jgi:hypothetical protein
MYLKFIGVLLLVVCFPFFSLASTSDLNDASWYSNYTTEVSTSPSFFDIDTPTIRSESRRSSDYGRRNSSPKESSPPREQASSIPNGDYCSHVSCYYTSIISLLEKFGFAGPFAEELAKFALMRQLIEDGTNRPHTVSMVGMVPGGINKRVVEKMGLKRGEVNEHGLKLTSVTANDGQGSYALYGPMANVWSSLAIVLVWDEYINSGQFGIKQELVLAWNESKDLSYKIAIGIGDKEVVTKYETELSAAREKAIKRVNSMYGPGGSSIENLVKNLEPVFSLKLGNRRFALAVEKSEPRSEETTQEVSLATIQNEIHPEEVVQEVTLAVVQSEPRQKETAKEIVEVFSSLSEWFRSLFKRLNFLS